MAGVHATPCEEALRALPAAGCAKGLGDLQLVCATATAGRALRRQLQELSGAPNIEAAAQLVAAPVGGTQVSVWDDRKKSRLGPEQAVYTLYSILYPLSSILYELRY